MRRKSHTLCETAATKPEAIRALFARDHWVCRQEERVRYDKAGSAADIAWWEQLGPLPQPADIWVRQDDALPNEKICSARLA